VHRYAAQQEAALQSFGGFVRYMWDVVDPAVLRWGWHLELLCQELEGLYRGVTPGGQPYPEEGAELVVCLPPGHGKSTLISVLYPAWVHFQDPTFRFLTCSHKAPLNARDSRRHRSVLTSPKFQALQLRQAIQRGEAALDGDGNPRTVVDGQMLEHVPWEPWGLAKDEHAKTKFDTSLGGGRQSSGMKGVLGFRCDGLIVDDPHDSHAVVASNSTASTARHFREGRNAYHGSLKSRVNKQHPHAFRLVTHQPLGYGDLAGDLIRNGARCVVLPLHHPGDQSDRPAESRVQVHPRDPRDPGEILAPTVFSEADYRDVSMSARHKAAQYQMHCPKEAGSTFQRRWFHQTYTGAPHEVARGGTFARVVQSLDSMFSEGGQSWVVLTTWGERTAAQGSDGLRPGHYLLDLDRDRMGLFDTCDLLRRSRKKWKAIAGAALSPGLVEKKANGAAVIEVMRNEGLPVLDINPTASKEARAEVFALELQAARVFFPEAHHAPWMHAFVEECIDFPGGLDDDQVDSASQYFVWRRTAPEPEVIDDLGALGDALGGLFGL
jgi:predicted phage terminase large subunit-like protein